MKQIESRRFYLQSSVTLNSNRHKKGKHTDNEILYKAAMAAAVVTIASSKITPESVTNGTR